MKKYTGHLEPWGEFVDVKVNAPLLLSRQLSRAQHGTVILSSVTDPYQQIEAKYELTRACLTALAEHDLPAEVLTKSPLVQRDIDILARCGDIEVGLTITTDNDKIRRIFEPGAPAIESRVRALETLHRAGIRTYAFVGPVLPMDPEVLARRIRPYAHRILIDSMNYPSKTVSIYRSHGLDRWLEPDHVGGIIETLRAEFDSVPVEVCK